MAALHVSAFAVDEGALKKSIIGGTLTGFLKKDNSPYLVNETIVVPEGKALVVEAGTALYFAEGIWRMVLSLCSDAYCTL